MKKRSLILLVSALISVLFVQCDGGKIKYGEPEKLTLTPNPPVEIRIIPDDSISGTISIEGDKTHFHCSVENISNDTIRIFEDVSSWGYYNISFEFTDESGKTFRSTHAEKPWDKNSPMYQEIVPGSHMSFQIDLMTDSSIAGYWKNSPLLIKGNEFKLKMKAVYSVEISEASQRSDVWTGTIESPVIGVLFKRK